jgi:hypothetical protein
MKKVLLLILIAALMFSCKKNETPVADNQYAEVSFNVTTLFPDADREWIYDYDVPQCDPQAIPGYALMAITDYEGILLEGGDVTGPNPSVSYFKALVFYTNGQLYTQSIKLPVAMCDTPPDCCETYIVTEFYLYDEEGDLIKAAPYPGGDDLLLDPPSEFFQFVTQTLPVEMEICAFEKKEFYIDVLCFTPDFYELFGFFWFEITEITVREVCFFGDICIDWWVIPSDWHDIGVPIEVWYDEFAWGYDYYFYQTNGIQPDMPAIFALVLYKWDGQDWIEINSFTNEYWDTPGEGAPLCFRYADYDATEDFFKIEMYIYGPWYYAGPPPSREDGIWGYTINDDSRDWPTNQPQHVWFFTDNALEDLDMGYPDGDGVIEFAWGYCVEGPEYQLPDLD